jgi:hypothetical protein
MPASHRRGDRVRHLVRQEVGDPDHGRRSVGLRKDLDRRIVVRRSTAFGGPHEPPRGPVYRNNRLAHHHAVAERHDAGARLELGIDDEAGNEARMQRPDVGDGSPYVFGPRLRLDFFSNRSHFAQLSLLE